LGIAGDVEGVGAGELSGRVAGLIEDETIGDDLRGPMRVGDGAGDLVGAGKVELEPYVKGVKSASRDFAGSDAIRAEGA